MYSESSFERKICDPSQLAPRVAQLASPRVFTNGCFDLLHRGHTTYLAQARNLGASLIVGVNSDTSVKQLKKGSGRPINTLEDRIALLAALECVDLVTWFDQDTPLELILRLRPEILVKGGDWSITSIIGAKEMLGWNGQVHSIPFQHERSTSTLIARIRESK